jgi:hypothetical protein
MENDRIKNTMPDKKSSSIDEIVSTEGQTTPEGPVTPKSECDSSITEAPKETSKIDYEVIKAYDSPILEKNNKLYNYRIELLSFENLSKYCEQNKILLLKAKDKKLIDEAEMMFEFKENDGDELKTFILSFDNYEHSEGFAILKKQNGSEKKFFLVPFSSNEHTSWIDDSYLYNLVAQKLKIEKNKLIFVSTESLNGLQADSRSCHTMALVCCIKTLKHQEVIESYIDMIIKDTKPEEKNGITVLNTKEYYPYYALLTQSLSKMPLKNMPEKLRQKIQDKYLALLHVTKEGRTKQVNPILHLKTIRYASKKGHDVVKAYKEGKGLDEGQKPIGQNKMGYELNSN